MERSQYQYTPVVGPVWREPVAERLAWLPRGQQPARGLPPNRLGDFARPEFAALYRPEGLQWQARDSYAGRGLLRARYDVSVYPPEQPAAPAYDPSDLAWRTREVAPGRQLPAGRLDYTVVPPFEPLYDPHTLEWQSRDSYRGRALPASGLGEYLYPLPPPADVTYNPAGLQWEPRGAAPGRPLPAGKLDYTVTPPFEPLYDPHTLEWQAKDSYRGRPLPAGRYDQTLYPLQPPVEYNPSKIEWRPIDSYFGRALPRALVDVSVHILDTARGTIIVEDFGATPGRLPAGRVPTREERDAAVRAQREAFGVLPRQPDISSEFLSSSEPAGAISVGVEDAPETQEVAAEKARQARQRALLLLLMAS